MEPALLGTLAVLALVDSTSFGTLLIPLWMLLAPQVRVSRILLYLGTVSVFYLGVGLLLLSGVDVISRALEGAGDVTALRWVQLVVGGALLLGSFAMDDGSKPKRVKAGEMPGPSRAERRWRAWRDRLTGENATVGATMTVALTATLLEVATMLPYLAAIGLLAASDAGTPLKVGVLVAYVVLMVVPALLALVVRLVARRQVEPWLAKLDAWLTRRSGSIMGWVVGIVGFLLIRDAYQALFL